ncbi:MAG: hypothetical protein HFJ41_02600 [Clostridia bacterium]|nr:hypothetical protein [Clostridia bacterium]
MKKNKKVIRYVLIILLLAWIILLIVDCIRLTDINNCVKYTKPLITIHSKEYENRYKFLEYNVIEYVTEYIGLGYSVKYVRANNSMGHKTEVNLFYIFPIEGYEVQ